ncbi:pyruvate kinase [Anaeroplasma bactoclasticum]|jgi:pyruvate kinase|uniref:Pyruvate kinase n=1 Tax=Anaeroplasma bactoclasticum TaxID=2088 RepID=A0A397RX16_9MOLU|nr:pyruvate kinase [Anaeroplasma bactoclasticum]RIA77792.1 pyruvate kinase [Anaeroplasma bactoclasticum]
MRKTKIICTLGPACDDEELLKKMILNGLDCARLNFSHGTHEEQKVRMDRVKKVRAELGIPLPILLDTKGPEIRVRLFKDGKVELHEGQEFTFCSDYDLIGDETKVGLTYPDLAKYVNKPGTLILADDGKVEFEVVRVEGTNVVTKVLNNASLSNRKSINIPNVIVDMPYISEVDRSDLIFGIQECVDYIAASFVRRPEDVLAIRELLDKYDTSGKIRIISKIENTEGIAKMDEIIEVSDGIMVARGDMGVEVPFKMLPKIQKELIDKCYKKGKIVVTATQMLDSMQQNPRPTRAEVSDVANAIYDKTVAIMLSGESAAGKYPLQSVTAMKDIAEYTESNIDYKRRYWECNLDLGEDFLSSICNAAVSCAYQMHAKAIICVTNAGQTAFKLSAYHPECPIIALTVDEKACRQLNLAWNVYPIYAEKKNSVDELFEYALQEALKTGLVSKGDRVIITGASSVVGNTITDTIKLHEI